MKYCIDTKGGYYVRDKAFPGDIEVPQRPSAIHKWDKGKWVTDTEKQKEYLTALVQKALDDKARQYGDNDITDSVTYKDSADPGYAAQGQAFQAWREAAWLYRDTAFETAGGNPIVEADFLAGLPPFPLDSSGTPQ